MFESGAQTAVVLRCGVRDCPEVEGMSRTIRGSRETEPESTPRLSPAGCGEPRRKTDTSNNSRHIIAVYARRLVVTQSLVCSSSLMDLLCSSLQRHSWLGTRPVDRTVNDTALGAVSGVGDGSGLWHTRCLLL